MATTDPQQLFQDLYGVNDEDSPAIHIQPRHSPAGVPYITAPGVVVLSRPHVSMAGLAGFLSGFDSDLRFPQYLVDPTPLQDAAQLCKVAGQLCYMSFGPKRTMNAEAKRYLDNLKSSGHGSVLEHACITLLLYGISRSTSHEIIRHRAGFAYSQISQRFVTGRTLRFVERPEYQSDQSLHTRFLCRIERTAREHQQLVDLLSARYSRGSLEARKNVYQAAHAMLTNETETAIVATANVRAWRHMLEQRGSPHAEIEIRILALRIFLVLRQAAPLLFDDYTLAECPDGTYAIRTEWGKV